jgi:hypothetical protein
LASRTSQLRTAVSSDNLGACADRGDPRTHTHGRSLGRTGRSDSPACVVDAAGVGEDGESGRTKQFQPSPPSSLRGLSAPTIRPRLLYRQQRRGRQEGSGRTDFSYLKANEPGSCRFAISRARQRLRASSSGCRFDQSSRCVSLPHSIAIKRCAPCSLPSCTGVTSAPPGWVLVEPPGIRWHSRALIRRLPGRPCFAARTPRARRTSRHAQPARRFRAQVGIFSSTPALAHRPGLVGARRPVFSTSGRAATHA